MRIKDIIGYLEELAPKSLQEAYDNSGLILGNEDSNISKILICLDSDSKALAYGIEQKCQLVISHHPAIFKALKNFTENTKESSILIKAIKNDIALYSSHTNFDSTKGGLSDLLCKRLGVEKIKVLKEQFLSHDEQSGGQGIGRFGDIKPISGENFIELAKIKLSQRVIRYVGEIPQKISKVAVYNGSYDRGIIEELRKISPDVLITGDLKYHDAQELMEYGIFTIDAGHYGTEIIFVEEMAKLLREQFPGLEILQYKGQDVFNYEIQTNGG